MSSHNKRNCTKTYDILISTSFAHDIKRVAKDMQDMSADRKSKEHSLSLSVSFSPNCKLNNKGAEQAACGDSKGDDGLIMKTSQMQMNKGHTHTYTHTDTYVRRANVNNCWQENQSGKWEKSQKPKPKPKGNASRNEKEKIENGKLRKNKIKISINTDRGTSHQLTNSNPFRAREVG